MIREKYGVRSPGLFEFYWWGAPSLAFEFIYSGGDDRWPWMLHVRFLNFNLFLHIPWLVVPVSTVEPYMRGWQQWGFSMLDDALHLHWNERTKVIWLPWLHKIHQRHEVRRPDGSWVPYVPHYEEKEPDGRETFDFPYSYKLKRGEIQNRTASVYVERRAWRPKWFTWTSLFEKERQNIDVQFSDEVGERTGSWKGGCIGCGYEMLPGETAEQTLRRMERERKF